MTAPALLWRKWRSFFHLAWFSQIWFLPVWLLLGLSRLVILVIPFRRLAPHLGVNTGVNPWVPVIPPAAEARAREIRRVIELAVRYAPWTANCFPQAITARLLLGFYGISYTFFFGLARKPDSQEMDAHAWVVAGRVAVSGGVSFDTYTVVGCFACPQLAQGSALDQPPTPREKSLS